MLFEIPLQPRVYEKGWNLAPGLSRLSVGAARGNNYKDLCPIFAEILDSIWDTKSQIVIEFWELFTNLRKHPLLGKYELVDATRYWKSGNTIEFSDNDQNKVYTIVDGSYCSLLCPSEGLVELLRSINAVEIVLIAWNDLPAKAEMLGPGIEKCSRPQTYYVQHIGSFDPVAFISRDHVHMEIYTKDEDYIKRILNCLSRFDSKSESRGNR